MRPQTFFESRFPAPRPHSAERNGALAQLGERLICIQEVRSSILLGSTKPFAEQKASPWQSLRSNDEKGSVTALNLNH